MELKDKVVVVTGAGSGIGAALCDRFAAEGPRLIVAIDRNGANAARTAAAASSSHSGVASHAVTVDVTDEAALSSTLRAIEQRAGTIDLYVGNAGIGSGVGVEGPNEVWRDVLDVNLMAHIYAARALLPGWLERGSGYMLITASAAGLLTNLGDAPYSVSKHAAVALAEWLAITYGDRGIGVSCLCPQGVRTPLLFPEDAQGEAETRSDDDILALDVVKAQRIIEPEEVAEAVVAALAQDQFLILPHPEVHDYEVARASDRERWLRSMRKLQAQFSQGPDGA